jgi:hypothetical protein
MKPALRIFSALLMISSSLFLLSMAPGGAPKGAKRHIIHQGKKLCVNATAFEAHHAKHIGIIDCELESDCTGEAWGTFHSRN